MFLGGLLRVNLCRLSSIYLTSDTDLKTYSLVVHNLDVTVEKKRVKNINLAIYPPDGRIRVSVPLRCSQETIESVILARLAWIEKKRAALLARPAPVVQQMIAGERILLFGKRYPLEVREQEGATRLQLVDGRIELNAAPGLSTERKIKALHDWYRQQLQSSIPGLLLKWQRVVGVTVSELRIRRMKSRWGTCNILDKRIWLNLELARMSPSCLEYVLVHELVHLLERRHNSRFWGFMDQFLPHWREIRNELKNAPLTE